ncbi:MAG: hypothetical protein ACRD4W_04325 [Nitrososphaeraceae archaeon]
MNKYFTGGAIAVIALAMIGTTAMIEEHSSYAQRDVPVLFRGENPQAAKKAPPAITGDNVYAAWWTNDSASNNNDVFFRASTDGGTSFGDKINLSNTTDVDSTRAEIDSDADSVVVTWWETNQTDDTPVMKVSNDNGATFGPLLTLATNGTLGEPVDEE